MQIADQNIPTYRSQTLRLFYARNWAISLEYTMISKRKIHNFYDELRPENSIGFTAVVVSWRRLCFRASEPCAFLRFARSFCSKTYELKRLILKRKTADSTELNTIKISSYTNIDINNNLFVSFRSQVKLTTDDVYYKHQITAMHRLAHEAYVEKKCSCF